MASSSGAPPTQQDKLFDEIVSQNQNFDHYERTFQEVLMELECDDVLETFRREYESLHNSFLKCHEGEKRLIKKCLDLSAETNACVQKIKAAEELSTGDQSTIEQLKKEIVKTKSKVSVSKETEITLREKVKQLKVDIKELERQVDRGASGVVGLDATINELTRLRAELHKDLDTQKTHLTALGHEMDYLNGRVGKAKEEKAAKEETLRALREASNQKHNEVEEQRDRKSRRERELRILKEELSRKSRQFAESQLVIGAMNDEYSRLEAQAQLMKENTDQGTRQLTALTRQMQQVHQRLHECADASEVLGKEITQLTQQLKVKDGEVRAVHKELLKQQQLLDAIEKRNVVLSEKKGESQRKRDSMLLQVQQTELDNMNITKLLESDRSQLQDLNRERDVLNKNYLKAQDATQKQKDWLIIKDNQKRNLDHQIKGYERHAQHQNEVVHQLTKEAEAYEREAAEHAVKYSKAMDECKTLDNLTDEEQLKIQDAESRLKQQHGMLETVLNERNLYSKNYNQLRVEISDMGRRFKIMINQIKQLKEEIQSKEKDLVTEEANVTAQTTLRKKHEIHIDTCKKKTEKRQKAIEAYNSELNKLNQIISDADQEKRRQERDHINVINERDILGTQLIKRNDELAQLYERIRIQQFQLGKGEGEYNDRLADVQHLELRISQLDVELGKMKNFASRLPDLKLLINKTQRELTREQCRVRGLLDECDNPQNVHRLHKLAWSEPQTFALHQRVHQLQKELVRKNNELEAKDRLIREKEGLFVELQSVIGRQPGPEVAEQLNVYQDTLKKKVGQMKAMKLSLAHFQDQVEHFKDRYEELNEELNKMGTQYKSRRRREKREHQKQEILNEMLGRDAGASQPQHEESYVGYTAPPRPRTQETDFDDTHVDDSENSPYSPEEGAGNHDDESMGLNEDPSSAVGHSAHEIPEGEMVDSQPTDVQ